MQEWFTRWETQMPTTISTALKNATNELERLKDTDKSNLVSSDPDPIASILNSKVTITPLGNGTSRILLETDGPYMAPNGFKISTPYHIPFIAEKISELKNETLTEVLNQTRKNTFNCYGI